jgi:hypothetical protein
MTIDKPNTEWVPISFCFGAVLICLLATVIANFAPTATAAQGYGYHSISTTSRYDPFYPQWLCSVTNLPSGLTTPGCVTGFQAD